MVEIITNIIDMDASGTRYRSPFEGLTNITQEFKKRMIKVCSESDDPRKNKWASSVRRGKHNQFLTNYSLQLQKLNIDRVEWVPFGEFKKHVQMLSLRDNQLTKIETDAFVGFSSLEYLGLAHNSISVFDSDFMPSSINLKAINLMNNQLKSFPKSILYQDRFPALEEVDLRDNPIPEDEIDQLWALIRLQGSKIKLSY